MPVPPLNLQRTQLLEEAIALTRRLKSAGVSDVQKPRLQKRLSQLGTQLQTYHHPLQRDRLPAETIPPHVRRCFLHAVRLLTRYPQLGGSQRGGTLNSPFLNRYRTDRLPEDWETDRFARHLCQTLALPGEIATEIDERLARIDRAIAQHRRIIQALLAEFNGLFTQKEVLRLFRALFGHLPLPERAIDGLCTPMQIAFAIDYQGEELRDRQLQAELREKDRQALAAFFSQIEQFSFQQFSHFPSFGYLDPHQIDPMLCDRLVAATGFPKADIRRAIARSVAIVPISKAEAFLVHDIWGHFWQFLLAEFDGDYAILAAADRPLKAGLAAYTADGPIALREVFHLGAGGVELAEDRARLFFHGEVRQRLGHLFTHLVGEMLADINEFKWLWQNRHLPESLPSSSAFKMTPTKLDLSLMDVDFLFLRVLQPLLSVRLSVLEESTLEQELLAEWGVGDAATRASLKQAIARLYHLFFEEYARCYQPSLTLTDGLFGSLISNLLYLQNAIDWLYTCPFAEGDLPFQDLLLLFISCYCSADCYADFWDIDDVLANYFIPCWLLLLNETKN
ncbi:MAG: hypothetical protein SVX43_01025 [Cyanobacteriota bacterium]|nr:hypothetical protein [Cyanobacteriota bacterium]